MTQKQIERYEVLREAKHDAEMVADIIDSGEYDCFAVAVQALPSLVTPVCRVHRYITSTMLNDRLKDFIAMQLNEINALIEEL